MKTTTYRLQLLQRGVHRVRLYDEDAIRHEEGNLGRFILGVVFPAVLVAPVIVIEPYTHVDLGSLFFNSLALHLSLKFAFLVILRAPHTIVPARSIQVQRFVWIKPPPLRYCNPSVRSHVSPVWNANTCLPIGTRTIRRYATTTLHWLSNSNRIGPAPRWVYCNSPFLLSSHFVVLHTVYRSQCR